MTDSEPGYVHARLDELETNPEKPGERWELSPTLGIEAFNVNIARLAPGTRLSQNAYHYHENQSEFFYAARGRCRVEVEDGSFDLSTDEVIVFDEGVVHLLHNPFEEPCTLLAIGWPPDGRRPVRQVRSYEDLLEERYGDRPDRLE